LFLAIPIISGKQHFQKDRIDRQSTDKASLALFLLLNLSIGAMPV
jgi:hypothetical protein